MKSMARIIQLYPKKEKPAQTGQSAPSKRALPEELETLRKSIVGDLLTSLGDLVRKVIGFPYIHWMTAEQVQQQLNLSASDLRKLSESGKIPCEELLGEYYYNAKDVSRMRRKQQKAKPM
jgi:hypothetical protein